MLSKGNKRKHAKRHGFLKRMATPGGRKVIRNRRSIKRSKITTVS